MDAEAAEMVAVDAIMAMDANLLSGSYSSYAAVVMAASAANYG